MEELLKEYTKVAACQGYTYEQIQGALMDLGVDKRDIRVNTNLTFEQWEKASHSQSMYSRNLVIGGLGFLFFGLLYLLKACMQKPEKKRIFIGTVQEYHTTHTNPEPDGSTLFFVGLLVSLSVLILGMYQKRKFAAATKYQAISLDSLETEIRKHVQPHDLHPLHNKAGSLP